MSPASSVRPWPCPTCGAPSGLPCRSRSTRRVTDTHIARRDAQPLARATRVGEWGGE